MDNATHNSDLIGQRQERLAKLAKLKTLGIEAYPAQSKRSHKIGEVISAFDELEGKTVTLTGRLMSMREHGKLAFADLEELSGRLQLFMRAEDMAALSAEKQLLGYDELGLLDVGDFVQATGEVLKTRTGQMSLLVKELTLLSKTLRPLPPVWRGLNDKELRYRRRYLDLALDADVRARFVRKSKFWQVQREFMSANGFIEVETPVLEHKTGGADARPFRTHHNELDQNLYLRISSELAQKRLLGGGFEKIYTLGPNFRNEGLSDEHLQEYYQIEWYWAYADYRDNMRFVRELFIQIAQQVYGTTKFSTRGHEFDLSAEWPEYDYAEIIKERHNLDIFTATDEELLARVRELGIKLSGDLNRNRLIDNLWKYIRRTLSGPAFLVNEPTFMSPLAKLQPHDSRLTQRFHVIIAGSELGNGYSEINDPQDQLARFVEQEQLREGGDDEAQMLDIDFIEMLEYGMPPTSGYGQSERVFWFFEDVTAREGTLFPLLRYELDPLTKKIYGDIIREEEPTTEVAAATSVAVAPSIAKLQPGNDLAAAEALLVANVTEPYQRYHSRMVSMFMREYAKVLQTKNPSSSENFDPELWAITGLIHDWDYGFDPAGHPSRNLSKLAEMGYSAETVAAIAGHKPDDGAPRTTLMAKALLAIDEMSGLLFAYSKMKGGYEQLDSKGVLKKFKDRAFAAKINRDEVQLGVDELALTMEEHVGNMLQILQTSELPALES